MIEKFKKIAAFTSAAVMTAATFLYFPSGTFKGMSLGILANALDEGELPFIPTEHAHKYENGFCTYGGCKEYETVTDTDNDGTYEISNAGQLYSFAAKVNSGEGSANAILTADIVSNVLHEVGINTRPEYISLQGLSFEKEALNAPYNSYKGIAALCYSV